MLMFWACVRLRRPRRRSRRSRRRRLGRRGSAGRRGTVGAVLLEPPLGALREGGLRDGDGEVSAGLALAGEGAGAMPETSSRWTSWPGATSRNADGTAILPGRSIGRHPSIASNPRRRRASGALRAGQGQTRTIALRKSGPSALEAREVPDARSGPRSIRSGCSDQGLPGRDWAPSPGVPAWDSRCLLPALEIK